MTKSADIARINSLHRELQELEHTRQDLQSEITNIDTLWQQKHSQWVFLVNQLSPLSTFPNEILAMIFEAGCSLPSSLDRKRPLEMIVSHVTRQFRNVAISNPRLWKRIRVTLRGRPSEKDLLSMYLTRSKMLPLDLRIDMMDRTHKVLLQYIESMCRILALHVDRWNRLSVVCHSREAHLDFLGCLSVAAAPLLDHLHIALIDGYDDDDDGAAYGVPVFTLGAPCLRHLRIRGSGLMSCIGHLSSVTSLHVHEVHPCMQIDYHQLHHAFDGLQTLTHLILSGGDIVRLWPRDARPINLPFLHSFHIGAHPDQLSGNVSGLLMAISAPLLHSLVLEYIIYDEFAEFFVSLQGPKYPSLRLLTIGQAEGDNLDKSLPYLSRAFPAITHLAFFYYDSVKLLEFLCPIDSADDLVEHRISPHWPTLHTLTLNDRLERAEAPPMLRNMVAERIGAGYPIQKIRLSPSILALDTIQQELGWLQERIQVEQGNIHHAQWTDSEDSWLINEETIVETLPSW